MKYVLLVLLLVFSACATASGMGDDFIARREITVVSREPGSGTRGAFIQMLGIEVVDGESIRDTTSIRSEVANSTNMVITSVTNNPYAIGYISLGTLTNAVKSLSIEGVSANAQTVTDGLYPIFRAFELVVTDNLSPLALDFIDFILSETGQNFAIERGYVPVGGAVTYVPSEQQGTLVVMGSTSVAPLMGQIAEAYEAIHPNVTIQLQISGSSAGIQAAINGTADIGMTSRPLTETELEQLSAFYIAFDALVIITHPYNPLNDISREQIRQIFIGEITHWHELID
ncbi:MAG: substrate-binding domain-containing protein [Turicibacter sp.]|nr:substrate-binding domain-containing protein [Turicibacter sp.]